MLEIITTKNPVQRCEGCRALYPRPRKQQIKLLQSASVRVVVQPSNRRKKKKGA
jgi:hypothetical protein